GFSEVSRLRAQVELQRNENAELAIRNTRLQAEVVDLDSGFAAVEERARSDLGLISPDESFYVFAGDGKDDDGGAE
ncbi:MAG: septum formation initiator family protein, partial [Gammaproteobacteria bacterium]